jgi:hypothetical protein
MSKFLVRVNINQYVLLRTITDSKYSHSLSISMRMTPHLTLGLLKKITIRKALLISFFNNHYLLSLSNNLHIKKLYPNYVD